MSDYDVAGLVLAAFFIFGLNIQEASHEGLYSADERGSGKAGRKFQDDEVLLATYSYYPTGSVKTVNMGNSLTISYTYHISGALKTAKVETANGGELYSEMLHYEDCGDEECTPQYNGNISRMAHEMAVDDGKYRDVQYTYDFMNRLVNVNDAIDNDFDEIFTYDAQGRITAQRRAGNVNNDNGGEYAYKSGSNKLESVANGMGGTADTRNMSDQNNFVYDSEGNLIEDKSKSLTISYDWRGMPVEFTRNNICFDIREQTVCGSMKLVMAYDGTGRRISKTRLRDYGNGVWQTELVTHYSGIGTEVRENFAGATPETKVVVNMPEGLGRYGLEDAVIPYSNTNSFEWFLKNHLGSTMLVYGTQWVGDITKADVGTLKTAYDYRAFGEQVSLTERTDKVTENFTGKELDDEIALNYFGARYLDPMLGMWISVDPMRQFASPYLYVGNFVNPINGFDSDGNQYQDAVETKQRMRNAAERNQHMADVFMEFNGDNPEELYEAYEGFNRAAASVGPSAGKAAVKSMANVAVPGGALKPVTSAAKRSIKEEMNERTEEKGSKWEAIKSMAVDAIGFIKDLWNTITGPTPNENVTQDEQQ